MNLWDVKFNALMDALRQDRRFAIFSISSVKGSSIFTDAARDLLDELFDLTTAILSTQLPLPTLAPSIQKVSDLFGKFHQFLDAKIPYRPGDKRNAFLVKKKYSIVQSMNFFAEALKLFVQNADNFLIRTFLGIRSGQIIRVIVSIESNPTAMNYTLRLRALVSELIISFFPTNLKLILQLLSLVQSRVDEIPPKDKDSFLNVFNTFTTEIRNVHQVYAKYSNPRFPEAVVKVTQASDTVALLLTAVFASLKDAELPTELATSQKSL